MSGTTAPADPVDSGDDVLPDAHWGTATTPLPPVTEDDDPDPDDELLPETPPDVVAMLGFDPRDVADDDTEAGADTKPPFAADAKWNENVHSRGQPENAGQFVTGGGPGGGGGSGGAKKSPAPKATQPQYKKPYEPVSAANAAIEAPPLDDEHKKALLEYVGTGKAEQLNRYLRQEGAYEGFEWNGPNKKTDATVSKIDEAIAGSVITKPLTVYRGVRLLKNSPFLAMIQSAQPGQTIDFGTSYTSTSTDEQRVASIFSSALRPVTEESVEFQIDIPQGAHALDVPQAVAGWVPTGRYPPTQFGDINRDAEVLLPRGSKFKIKGMAGQRIHVELVGPQDAQDSVASLMASDIAQDAEWKETDHTRGQPGNAGQFGSGGGATHANSLPSPPPAQGAAAKKVHAEAHQGLFYGDHPTKVADKLKALAANYSHPYLASYATKLLGHIEQAHGLKPGSLGKAVPKPPGAAVKAPAPAASGFVAPVKKAAPGVPPVPPPAPAPAPAPPAPKSNLTGPDPHPDSTPQKDIHGIATGSAGNPDKVDQIKQAVQKHMLPAGGFGETFAKQWIAALGGDPDTPAKPAVIPANTPVPGSGATHLGAVKGAPARVAKAEKLENAAQKIDTTDSSQALAVAPSLSKAYWSKIPGEVKKSISSYGGGGYTPINDALRGDDPKAHTGFAATAIANIDSLFDHDEAISTNSVILRRGEETPPDIIAKWKASLKDGWPPCIYTRTGYTSASMAHKPAFAHKPVWFHFVAPKGTRMVGLAGYVGHHENEILLQHGQTMEIYEIYEANGKTHVKATLK